MRLTRLLLVLLFFALTLNCARAQQSEQTTGANRIAIRAARLLDVAQGTIISQPVAIVEADKIVAVGSNLSIPPEAKIIDLGNVTLMPGLIDAHTHVTYHFDETGHFGLVGDSSAEEAFRYAAENARATLNSGVTTIRNLGAGGLIDVALRNAIKDGKLPGPRMLVSGAPLTPDYLRDVKREDRINRIREFVGKRIAEGVDVIKIFEVVDGSGRAYFSSDEIRAAVEEAAKHNLKVAVHAHEAASVKAAIKGGCTSIEHGTFLDGEAIKLLVENRVALVPTLYLPTHYLEHKSQFSFGASSWEFFENLKSKNFDNFKAARNKGVWIVAGSDAVAGLHGHNSREIIWLAKAGMKPEEAIRAATIDAARLLGLEEQIGEIKVGKIADLIAVSGNPLQEISDVENVVFVMKDGRVFRSEVK